jgi:hypothetical protein
MDTSYHDFVSGKLTRHRPVGFDADVTIPMFPFQRDIVTWALRRGRCAIFASTGLGKSRMQVAWAHHVAEHTGRPVLILAPLAVARQTAEEGVKVGVDVRVCRDMSDVIGGGVFITNYDRLHLFDACAFGGVALDESSIIKHHDAKTLKTLMDAFSGTEFRLACTATPSPNDYVELGTHAEFLGICSRAEMLSEYFVHDGGETQKWRLKGHARKMFWRFVASWGALVRSPSDLGYDGSAYVLPPMTVEHHIIAASQEAVHASGLLFAAPAATLTERRSARKGSVGDRVRECAEMVNASSEAWVVWCDLNAESEALTKAIRGAVEVRGSMTGDEKERALYDFASGKARVIVSKPSICGFGLNWQHCHRMAFVGVTDSWEAYHQATKRIHRFGQKLPCDIHVFASELESAVIANLKRKEADAIVMGEELAREAGESVRESIIGSRRVTNSYHAERTMAVPSWLTEGE